MHDVNKIMCSNVLKKKLHNVTFNKVPMGQQNLEREEAKLATAFFFASLLCSRCDLSQLSIAILYA